MARSIFICEDNPNHREAMEAIVRDYISLKNYDMPLSLSTDNPTELLNYLDTNKQKNSLYILDVDLQHELNGIALAAKIRENDTFGTIVFVTTHAELSYLTFRYRIEALDYILKDDIEDIPKKVQECIDIAYSRNVDKYSKKDHFQVKSGAGIVENIPIDTIMLFSAHHKAHKIVLHMENGRIEFYGTLDEIEKLSEDFYRCHRVNIVNTKNIKRVNKADKTVDMVNGEIALVAAKKIKDLIAIMQK